MSTIARLELERQAASQLELLCAAQHELIGVLRRQITEANKDADLFRSDYVKAEALIDRFFDRLADILKANALGVHGSPMERLDRIASRLRSYIETEELVKLCLNGERPDGLVYTPEAEAAICAEVDRIKAEGMPF
jgi:hypothetical protein